MKILHNNGADEAAIRFINGFPGLVERIFCDSPDFSHFRNSSDHAPRIVALRGAKGGAPILDAGGCTATAPATVFADPRRVTAADAVSRRVAGAGGGRAWRARMATAARQDLWRRLRRARGMAPFVMVRALDDGCEIALAACWMDGAPAAPRTLDALQQIFQDGLARNWSAWADRAESRR